MEAPARSDGASEQRRWWLLPFCTLALALATIAGSLWWTDDAFPIAPFRMFSYGNRPNTVVRDLRLEGELENGEQIRVGWKAVGLRRAELEGQTHPNRRVPDENMEALARVYNERRDPDLVHLQVVVRRIAMVDGRPAPDGETFTVIGDWASDDFDGLRVEVDLPLDEPTPGYRR
ncbi:hypothetical protein [Actinospongicola halichondriae]|uniref:hypothetical protein n=1 Tax=Actinospongicola halichondriae TaxID=3236844 RepID=UPI003D5922DB